MTDLSQLAKDLQAQVDVITKYLEKEKLPPPSFVPTGNPMTVPITSLPPEIEKARVKAHSLSWNIATLLTPPVSQVVFNAFSFYVTVCIRWVVEKKIALMIPIDSPGVPVSELSQKTGIPENRVLMILRQVSAVHIFREVSPRVFAHTSASAVLAMPEFSNSADLILHFTDEGYKAAGYFTEALDKYGHEFDKVQKPELRTAFNMAFNTDMHYFDYIYTPENIPKYGDRFGRSMMGSGREELMNSTLDAYDWSQFKPGDKIVDVGGGVGHVGVGVAKRVKPGVEVIVQDRPSVVEQGRKLHGHIVKLEPHNFFDKQPIRGAAVYYMRLILHDWPDAICRTILENIVPAMTKDSKLLILDALWKGDEYWVTGKDDEEIIGKWTGVKRDMALRTLHMTSKLGAKERTEKEWQELFASAGLKLVHIYAREGWQSIFEAVKA